MFQISWCHILPIPIPVLPLSIGLLSREPDNKKKTLKIYTIWTNYCIGWGKSSYYVQKYIFSSTTAVLLSFHSHAVWKWDVVCTPLEAFNSSGRTLKRFLSEKVLCRNIYDTKKPRKNGCIKSILKKKNIVQ